jgi:hypothetical protein
MDTKAEIVRKLAAEIHQEIEQAEPIADEQLERNIQRVQALLRWLSEERDLRAAKQSASTRPLVRPNLPRADQAIVGLGKLPKRDAIVMALEKIGTASPPTRVAAVVRTLFGLVVSTSQFASFRKGDERSYRRNPRNRVYIVPALSAADLSPLAGTVALSNWPTERRVIGGYSQRADALRALVKAYLVYGDVKDEPSTAIMRVVARELPSIAQYAPDLDAIGRAATKDLQDIEARDIEEREAAAHRAAQLDPATQLFGRAPLALVGGD